LVGGDGFEGEGGAGGFFSFDGDGRDGGGGRAWIVIFGYWVRVLPGGAMEAEEEYKNQIGTGLIL